MKRCLIFVLAASLFLVTPAVASAARGGGHYGGQTVIKKEKVIVYSTTQQRDYRHYRGDRRDYRPARSYQRPPRHAPAHGYYKNHPAHRYQSKKVVRRHAPSRSSTVTIGVPSIIVRINL